METACVYVLTEGDDSCRIEGDARAVAVALLALEHAGYIRNEREGVWENWLDFDSSPQANETTENRIAAIQKLISP
jgi:hypothetical protein